MKISKISIDRPVTTVMFILIAVLVGIISLTKMSVNLFPNMDIPYAVVITGYEGAGPSEIESLVTEPLEQALATVPNIKEVNSTSANESSIIILTFVDSTDMNFAVLDVREKVDMIKDYLPSGIKSPIISKIDINAQPILTIGIGGNYNLVELNDIIENKVKDKLERIPGVASVDLSGTKEKEIKVTLISEKMNGYNIDASTIANILRAENISLPIGQITQGDKELMVRSVGEFQSVEDIRNLPIPLQNGVIYLRDVAEVTESYKDMDSFAYMNNEPCIIMSIQKQSTANTVEVSKKIHKELDSIIQGNTDLTIKTLMDQSEMINQSISAVESSAIIGGILALIILFIFLRHIKSTFIVGVAIPVSIIVSFALMYFTNIEINIISLGGLSLGIGMLVDNSIVVLENIFRHRQNGEGKKSAAEIGVTEVGTAVLASTLTTIAVFVPMVFVEGMSAKIFRDLSLTVSYSLIASLVVALTLVPMMASKMLNVEKIDETKEKRLLTRLLDRWEKVLDSIDSKYRKLLLYTLNHRKRVSLICILAFIGSLCLLPFTGMDFMPPAEEGKFTISVKLPKGSKLEETLEIVDEVTAELSEVENIKDVFATVGGSGTFGGRETNIGSITVDVGSEKERDKTVSEFIEDVRNHLSKKIVGVELSYAESQMSMTGSSSPITIEISGDEMDVLNKTANDVKDIVESIEGTREVKTSIEETMQEINIIIDREKAAKYGINSATAARELNQAVKGNVATKYKVNGSEVDVLLVYDQSDTQYLDDIKSLTVKSPLGVNIPISAIAELEYNDSPTAINHKDNKRMVTVNSDLLGIDTNTARTEIEKKLSNYNMPKGYSYEFGGDVEEMMNSFKSLALALLMAVLLVFMILAAQFESFLHPFIIMFSVPVALTGAIVGLFITRNSVSMPAIIGFIMLVGIVVNNAIVLVDYINQLIKKGYDKREAILLAGPTRLRPILMTTLTTVLAMVPMAIGIGEGSKMMAPMAVSVIGGLLCSTLLTLIIVPLNYTLFEDMKAKVLKKHK